MNSEKAVLGADYSASAAYVALVSGNSVLTTATLHVDKDPRGFWLLLKQWLAAIDEEYGPDYHFYIEMPWVRNDHYPHAGVAMMRTATFIEIACYELGFTPILVSPGTWRKAVYGNGHPKEDLKELARRTAEEKFNFPTKYKNQHNICEAILIAHYGGLGDEREPPEG